MLNLKLKKVAVTGGLGAGKTSVCQILKACGAYVVSSDEIVHQLLAPETTVGQQVIDLLGHEILNNQKIDRKKVAQKVFSKPELLKRLEKIIHPEVFHEIERRYQEIASQKKYALFVAEVPLLFESEGHKYFDTIITVAAREDICRQRFRTSSKQSDAEFEARMKRQLHPSQKAAQANYVIENNGSQDELKTQVIHIYQNLTK